MLDISFDAQRIVCDQDGVWLCLRTPDAAAARGFVLRAKGKFVATLKKFHKKRSLDANA